MRRPCLPCRRVPASGARPRPPTCRCLRRGWVTCVEFMLRNSHQFLPARPQDDDLGSVHEGLQRGEVGRCRRNSSPDGPPDRERRMSAIATGPLPGLPARPGHSHLRRQQGCAPLRRRGRRDDGRALGVAWYAKFNYHFWRPITTMRFADTDGNDPTGQIRCGRRSMVTPPYPDFRERVRHDHELDDRGAHHVLGTSRINLYITSAATMTSTRHYEWASQLTSDAINGRVWSGIPLPGHQPGCLSDGPRESRTWPLEPSGRRHHNDCDSTTDPNDLQRAGCGARLAPQRSAR